MVPKLHCLSLKVAKAMGHVTSFSTLTNPARIQTKYDEKLQEDRPLIAQLGGDDPKVILQVTRLQSFRRKM